MVCVFLLLLLSCGSKAQYAGVYQTEKDEQGKRSELELNENGEGSLRTEYFGAQ